MINQNQSNCIINSCDNFKSYSRIEEALLNGLHCICLFFFNIDATGTHILCVRPFQWLKTWRRPLSGTNFYRRDFFFCWLFKSPTVVIECVLWDQ